MNLDDERPLTWVQQPSRELRRLAGPIAVSLVSYAIMTLADTMFVGWLGPSELAGVGLAGTAVWALICFSQGLMRGAKALVSQARGAGDEASLGPLLGATLLSAAALSVATWIVAVPAHASLPHLAATPEAGGAAADYFAIRMLGAPVWLLGLALREIRYGLGDSRAPMIAALVANLGNVVLDYVLIFPCGLGVEGAAWATVVALAVEAALMVRVQARERYPLRSARWPHVVAVWRMGVPAGVQHLMEMGAFSLLAVLLSMTSELDMAAHMIALQAVHFSFLPALAIGEGASVMVGEAVGGRRDDLVLKVARTAMLWAGLYTFACAVVFVAAGTPIGRAFTDDPALVALSARLLVVGAVFQVFDAANIVGRCVLRGVGDVRFAAVVCIAIAWCMTPPGAYLLGIVAGWGAVGAWIGLCAEMMVGVAALWWRLERGGWRAAAARALEERERAGEEALALAS